MRRGICGERAKRQCKIGQMLFSRSRMATLLAAVCALPMLVGQPANSSFEAMVKDAKTRIREMTVDQLKTLQSKGDKFTLVDVREDNEWDAGHAAGAVHIGRGVLERDIAKRAPQKDGTLVLYCHAGSRSALAADALMKMGYSNVFSLAGGFNAYQSARLTVEKPAK